MRRTLRLPTHLPLHPHLPLHSLPVRSLSSTGRCVPLHRLPPMRTPQHPHAHAPPSPPPIAARHRCYHGQGSQSTTPPPASASASRQGGHPHPQPLPLRLRRLARQFTAHLHTFTAAHRTLFDHHHYDNHYGPRDAAIDAAIDTMDTALQEMLRLHSALHGALHGSSSSSGHHTADSTTATAPPQGDDDAMKILRTFTILAAQRCVTEEDLGGQETAATATAGPSPTPTAMHDIRRWAEDSLGLLLTAVHWSAAQKTMAMRGASDRPQRPPITYESLLALLGSLQHMPNTVSHSRRTSAMLMAWLDFALFKDHKHSRQHSSLGRGRRKGARNGDNKEVEEGDDIVYGTDDIVMMAAEAMRQDSSVPAAEAKLCTVVIDALAAQAGINTRECVEWVVQQLKLSWEAAEKRGRSTLPLVAIDAPLVSSVVFKVRSIPPADKWALMKQLPALELNPFFMDRILLDCSTKQDWVTAADIISLILEDDTVPVDRLLVYRVVSMTSPLNAYKLYNRLPDTEEEQEEVENVGGRRHQSKKHRTIKWDSEVIRALLKNFLQHKEFGMCYEIVQTVLDRCDMVYGGHWPHAFFETLGQKRSFEWIDLRIENHLKQRNDVELLSRWSSFVQDQKTRFGSNLGPVPSNTLSKPYRRGKRQQE